MLAITLLLRIRQHASVYLPAAYGSIALDILVAVMESEPPLTVKRLFTEVPHSPMGLRPHFNALVASGWISLAAPAGDARVKLVRPTAMLIDRFEQLSRALEAVVIDCRQHQVITEVAPRRHLHPVPFVSAAGSQGIPAVFQKLRHPLY